jgi:hypothetical protein
VDRGAFTGEGSLEGRGRHHVACLEHDGVAQNDFAGRNDQRTAVAQHPCARRGHGSQGEHGAFRSILLEKTYERVDHQDRGNRDCVSGLAEHGGHHAGSEQ